MSEFAGIVRIEHFLRALDLRYWNLLGIKQADLDLLFEGAAVLRVLLHTTFASPLAYEVSSKFRPACSWIGYRSFDIDWKKAQFCSIFKRIARHGPRCERLRDARAPA